MICNKQGQVLRRFPTMTQETAEKYSASMMSLASQARSVVRDLNAKVMASIVTFILCVILICAQNELRYLRVRAKRHEIMVAFGSFHSSLLLFCHLSVDVQFIVIVIQRWSPASKWIISETFSGFTCI